MQSRDIIKAICDLHGTRKSWLAKRLGLSRQAIYQRLDRPDSVLEMNINTFVDMASALNYKIVVMPENNKTPENGYILTND